MLDAVVAEFPNEFCKRILENVIGDDDELVEGIGRATSRLNFNKEVSKLIKVIISVNYYKL